MFGSQQALFSEEGLIRGRRIEHLFFDDENDFNCLVERYTPIGILSDGAHVEVWQKIEEFGNFGMVISLQPLNGFLRNTNTKLYSKATYIIISCGKESQQNDFFL